MPPADSIDVPRLLADCKLASVEYRGSLPSTQDRAHQLAADGKTPLLVVADAQTAGRGRGGNRWWTGGGSLAFSLLIDPVAHGLPRQPVSQASLAAGIALIDAVSVWLGDTIIGLHWPNDVFAAGRKLAGILIDVLPDGRHIVGVGLNVNNTFSAAPDEVRLRATSLIELSGQTLDRTEILILFLRAFEGMLAQLATNPAELGCRFDRCCLQIGHDLTIELANRRTTGRCAGIAPDGALLLDTLSGRQKFYSGVLR